MEKSSPSPKSVKRSKSKVAKKSHPNPMADAIGQALDADKNRTQQKYDGVVGALPDWVPDPLQEEFKATRDYLLDYFSDDPASPHTKVKKLMAARKKESFPTSLSKESPPIRFPFTPYIPPEVERDLDALIYIQQIISLKKDKGISAYLGKGGVSVFRGIVVNARQKKIAQYPRRDPLQKLIISIVEKKPDITWQEALVVLKTKIGGPVITFIDEEEGTIGWQALKNPEAPTDPDKDPDTTFRTSAISGLKDRVRRAKGIISAR
jgi:hypothetical protein